MKKKMRYDENVSEALRGLAFGLVMMIIVFLVMHYVFGIQAFD